MSLRARVTLAFTAMLAVVLAAVGVFLYVRVGDDLRATQQRGLRSRSAQLVAAVRHGEASGNLAATPGIESDEDVAQVLSADGTVLAAGAAARAPLMSTGQLAAALSGARFLDRPGDAQLDESVRLLAAPVRADGRSVLAVVGASRDEVDEALSSLLRIEAIGLSAALLIGAGGTWLLAGAVVRPVRAALERERRFIADASHELRTPLAVLKSELEVARIEDGDAASLRAALASAQEETDRLVRLAEDLLVLARADERGLALRPRDVALDSVLDRAARGFDGVRRRPSGLRVTADPDRLEQAVRNLVDNAARHGAPPIELGAQAGSGTVCVRVRDHGAGLPAGFAEGAFDRFSRAHAARAQDGAGLGLAIVDAIACAHGGSVELADAHPGTVARLRLPHRSLIDPTSTAGRAC